MVLINTADTIYVGSNKADAIYLGDALVWPTQQATVGHRYWRLYLEASNGNDIFSMAEVEFRTTAGVPLLFSGGTASASSTYDDLFDTYGPQFVTDSDVVTRWSSKSYSPQTWEYDYGVGKSLNIVEVSLQTRFDSGTSDHMPTVFTPQWSDDGINWTSMTQIIAGLWVDGQLRAFPVTPLPAITGHRYWRFTLDATTPDNVGYTLSEVEFRTEVGVPLTPSGGIPSAGDTYEGNLDSLVAGVSPHFTYGPDKACDGDLATIWSSNGPTQPQWWAYDYGTNAPDIVEMAITARAEGGHTRRRRRLRRDGQTMV